MFLRRFSSITSSAHKLSVNGSLIDQVRCFQIDPRKKFDRVPTIKIRQSSEELFPYDYSQVSSDFDEEVYKQILLEKDPFSVERLVKIDELFENRCHFGHKIGSLNDFMKPYLFGHRQNITIFDLNKTAEHLRKALNFIAHVAFRDGIILFVNSDPNTAHLVEKAAFECGEYSQCRDFDMRSLIDSEAFFKMPIRTPDVILIFKTKAGNFDQHTSVRMAAKLMIPSVAIVDSDCDPRLVTYPVPANDDTTCSIALYSRLFREAILRAKEKRKEIIKKVNSGKNSASDTTD